MRDPRRKLEYRSWNGSRPSGSREGRVSYDRESKMGNRLGKWAKTLAAAAFVATLPLVSALAEDDGGWRHHGNWGGGDGWHRDHDWHGGGYGGGYGGGGGNFFFYGGGPSYYYPPPPTYYYPPAQPYYPPPQPYYAQPYYPPQPYYYGPPEFGLQFNIPIR